jgi:pyruvate dehydrogenase E1 component alpha subunit
MLRVRRVEERIQELYPRGDMRCPTHFSIGQEAVAAGVCANLNKSDYVISAHRSHAHYINKGGSLRAMFAELYGKSDGCAAGKGGSMHLIDLSVNFLGCVPIVGSTIAIGTGAAFGAKMKKEEAITAIFFGDGAVETGVFHESLNFAALEKLKILFVCENNLYSVNTPLSERQPDRPIIDLARGHGIRAAQLDGQHAETVSDAASRMIQSMRTEGGPAFLEFMTYRWLEHCGPNDDLKLNFRPAGEYESWQKRCPINLYRNRLSEDRLLDDAQFNSIVGEIDAEIADALSFAENSPFPTRDKLSQFVYA